MIIAAVLRQKPPNLHPRLHFPVSGMSISRTLFFIPARIPPDSLGFLFFPEEFFHRNLLLIVRQELRITPESPEYSGIPVPAKQNYRDLKRPWLSERRWRGVGEASAHIMGCGERTPSTQYIAVTLTSRATRRCTGSRTYVHHSLSDFTILGVTFCMHNITIIMNNNSN